MTVDASPAGLKYLRLDVLEIQIPVQCCSNYEQLQSLLQGKGSFWSVEQASEAAGYKNPPAEEPGGAGTVCH